MTKFFCRIEPASPAPEKGWIHLKAENLLQAKKEATKMCNDWVHPADKIVVVDGHLALKAEKFAGTRKGWIDLD